MRKVKEEDFKIFWKEADKKYNLANTYYWYPLIEKAIENTIVSYRTTELLKSRFKETLERNIQELNVLMYLKMEYQIDGSEYYIIESKEFDLDRYSEEYYITTDLSGLIYYSHEDTISFSGDIFINIINDLNITLPENVI